MQVLGPNRWADNGDNRFAPENIMISSRDANIIAIIDPHEAALWRFKTLFEQEAVDGLYFTLPTRVAATAMLARIKAFRDIVFGAAGPAACSPHPGRLRRTGPVRDVPG